MALDYLSVMTVKDYEIVAGTNPEKLREWVMEMIGDGWEPQGGVHVVWGKYYQAMIKRG